jgi:hypothetical protein
MRHPDQAAALAPENTFPFKSKWNFDLPQPQGEQDRSALFASVSESEFAGLEEILDEGVFPVEESSYIRDDFDVIKSQVFGRVDPDEKPV